MMNMPLISLQETHDEDIRKIKDSHGEDMRQLFDRVTTVMDAGMEGGDNERGIN
jgi:hypothetical protein